MEKNRYHNMSEGKKQRLKEYKKSTMRLVSHNLLINNVCYVL